MATEHIHTESETRQQPTFCKQCEKIKSPDDFYTSNKVTCKSCLWENVRANSEKHADHYRAYDRKLHGIKGDFRRR